MTQGTSFRESVLGAPLSEGAVGLEVGVCGSEPVAPEPGTPIRAELRRGGRCVVATTV